MADTASGILVANTTTTVQLDTDFAYVEVTNVDGAAAIAVTVDGSDPSTSGGAGVVLLPAVVCEKRLAAGRQQATVIKLKSTGTPQFSVNGAS